MPRNGKMLVSEAIAQLCPGAAFSLHNEDFTTLQWIGTPPSTLLTLAQVTALIGAYVAPPTVDQQIASLQAQVNTLMAAQVKPAAVTT